MPSKGGVAEDHVAGSDVGPLFQAIMVSQFSRLETGDRFFYLNETWTPTEMAIFQQGNSLAKVIESNTTITNLQSDVFTFKASISGTVFNDANHNARQDRGESGLANVTVRLLDATDGSVIATTQTDRMGNYQFTAVEGLTTGQFRVQEVLPTGWTQTAAPQVQAISRGDTYLGGADFGDYQGEVHNPPPPWTPPPPPWAPSPPPHGNPHQPPPPPWTPSPTSLIAAPPQSSLAAASSTIGAASQVDDSDSDGISIPLGNES